MRRTRPARSPGWRCWGSPITPHYVLSAQSDPLIVSLCLGAVDCHCRGRPRWAFVLLVLASLGRPEVWPFIAVYAIWAWRAVPSMRMAGRGGRDRRVGAVVRDPRR